MFAEVSGGKSSSSQKSEGELAANDAWLESQIVTDRVDVNMHDDGADVLSDFEYDRNEEDGADLEDIDD